MRIDWFLLGLSTLSFAVGTVMALTYEAEQTRIHYTEACAKISGEAIWNGNNWECFPSLSLTDYGDD